ncbi:Polyglutamate biosynthesis protein [Penicillium longicatenatum]|uniref:Polyglutamate biosynthesis protein n=1 Tax=Penicillium longicatenatum TaxID=1561947 RepID=UPI002548859E|nr:Polyglutamate biosynthesis protein [Penicillium longicatenatum]KAJ5636289.1 Polyglutamate biosynthesis protein [Penicillium longicatenatum]
MTTNTFTLTFLGDVMLARLIDQLLPNHVASPTDARTAAHFKSEYPSLSCANYTPSAPWGTTLPLLRTSDLLFINLETSVTTTTYPWPNKEYNYRLHPANLAPVLHAAKVDYTSLANNHILDYSTEGLIETVWTLKEAGISFAGAGENIDEAYKPATLYLPRSVQEYHSRRVDGEKVLSTRWGKDEKEVLNDPGTGYPVYVYSASDHPQEWGATVPIFHFIEYSSATRERLRRLMLRSGEAVQGGGSAAPALKIFSVHWGSNYTWCPSDQIRSLAHFLIDECGVDIVHGHSSHHIQGVEVYRGKVVIYGCGDFVDDYMVREKYRNDLGAAWRVIIKEGEDKSLMLDRLEIFPTRVDQFRANLLEKGDKDHRWIREKIRELSGELGTTVSSDLGEQGQILIDIR